MRRRLRLHQRKALEWAAGRSRIPLFMQMRLGKTLVIIRRVETDPGLALVVCPLSVVRSWSDELSCEGIDHTLLVGPSSRKRKLLEDGISRGTAWFVVNPEGVRACPDILTDIDWHWTIVDESTCIRNPRAQVTKMFVSKCTSPFRAILSGMPAPEGIEDYVTQMLFLHGEFMNCTSFWQWREKYMIPGGFGWEVPPLKRRKIIDEISRLSFMMRASEAGLHFSKVYETRTVKLPASVRRIYRQVVREYRLGEAETKWTLVVQAWMAMLASGVVPAPYRKDRLYCSRHKISELVSLLSGELYDSRVVIFSRFTREIDAACREIRGAVAITGSSWHEDRMRTLKMFQQGKISRLVLQEQGIGEKGLDLSKADAIIFLSNVWSLETRKQCEARADVIGRAEPVLIVDIVSEGTIDEAVVQALREKEESEISITRSIVRKCRKGGLL